MSDQDNIIGIDALFRHLQPEAIPVMDSSQSWQAMAALLADAMPVPDQTLDAVPGGSHEAGEPGSRIGWPMGTPART